MERGFKNIIREISKELKVEEEKNYKERKRKAIKRGLSRGTKYVFNEYVVKSVLDSFLNNLEGRILNKEKIKLKNIGTFSTYIRKEFNSRDPRTGESIKVPRRRALKFKISRRLRDKLKDIL